ncbi:SIMPL domain-containing protein [Mycobacterium sp. 141]|uniref:SIMPL domain-containing protein n=1 Tax=Mycobacterium sp. 141 TaxID=1120797 RepID=UPI000369D25E|nr:SIMPL domain-containing protein [Mycobacterium sp. 141]
MAIAANAKLRTRALVAVLAALLITGVSACDSKSGPDARGGSPDTRQVTVIGSGKVQGTPDTLTANVAMEFVAPDVTAALNQSSQRQQAVIDALVGNKVDRKDINTTRVSVQPQTNSDGTITTGYRASNAIDVKIRDITAASQLLALIASTGGDATRINSVSYSIEDDSQLVKDARAQAFDDAKSRAEQYAQLSGLNLGKVISISEQSSSTPPTPMPRMAMDSVPLEPGQQTVNFTVTVVWELT